MQRYQYNSNGEVINVKPLVSLPDFRAYPTEEVADKDGNRVTIQLCCELVGNRWEYFISHPHS